MNLLTKYLETYFDEVTYKDFIEIYFLLEFYSVKGKIIMEIVNIMALSLKLQMRN